MEDDRSFKHKLLQSSFCCCFTQPDAGEEDNPHNFILRSSSSSAHEFAQLKDKCRTLFSRVGKKVRRNRSSSPHFGYDPFSYALNFDEPGYQNLHDNDDDDTAAFPFRNFSSRLPASPPPEIFPTPRQVSAVS